MLAGCVSVVSTKYLAFLNADTSIVPASCNVGLMFKLIVSYKNCAQRRKVSNCQMVTRGVGPEKMQRHRALGPWVSSSLENSSKSFKTILKHSVAHNFQLLVLKFLTCYLFTLSCKVNAINFNFENFVL